jgi:hypothetical protein
MLLAKLKQIDFMDCLVRSSEANNMRAPKIVKEAAEKDLPGWRESQEILRRSTKELIKRRFKSFWRMPAGAAIGSGIGTLAAGKRYRGAGAYIGGLLGLTGGSISNAVARYKTDKKYLADKGIKYNLVGKITSMTPEAKKKYIDKYEHKGKQ